MEPLEFRRLLTAYVVNNSGESGGGTLSAAIAAVNAGDKDEIKFNLATPTISLTTSALDPITRTLTIYGYNQTGGARVQIVWAGSSSTVADGLVLGVERVAE